MTARIDHGGDDGPAGLDEIINREMTLRHKRAAIVVEFYRENLGIERDAVRRGEITFEKFIAGSSDTNFEIVIRRLDIFADCVEDNDWQALYD